MTRIETSRVAVDFSQDKGALLIVLGKSYTDLLYQAELVSPGLPKLIFAYIFDRYSSCGDSGLHGLIEDLVVGESEENEREEQVTTIQANLKVPLEHYIRLRRQSTGGGPSRPRIIRMGGGEEA